MRRTAIVVVALALGGMWMAGTAAIIAAKAVKRRVCPGKE